MKSPAKRSVISTGTTTIVLIFVLLCLLTFSVLSLVSAQANMRMSQKSADRTSDFYKAENTASDLLYTVIQCVEKKQNLENEEDFLKAVQTELEPIDEITFTDSTTLNWQVPVEEEQSLNVTVVLSHKPFPNGNHYKITSWNTSSSYDWGADQTLPLPTDGTFPELSKEEE